MNQQQWAAALLQRLNIPQTPGAMQAIIGWTRAEGGHWNNTARFNPLNTTQPEPGAGNTGTQGNIKVYRDWNQGLNATVKTLRNGLYGGILHALKAGDAEAVGRAIEKSPWGTGGLAIKTIAGTKGVSGVSAPSVGRQQGRSGSGGNATGGFDAGTSPQGLATLIAAATAPQRTAPPATLRPAPAFAAKAPTPAGYQGIDATGAPAQPKTSIDDRLQQAAQLTQLALPQVQQQSGSTSVGGTAGATRGQVKVAPGANRQGVGLSGTLTHFVSLVAGRAREPITITTGTNHDRLTVNGRVSDHYDGHAADIAVPVDSAEGDHIASAALQAAGVPKKKAMQMARNGGLYTINSGKRRIQVIWKTYEGGNHHNHVHIGIR